jgi:hypothetical protein
LEEGNTLIEGKSHAITHKSSLTAPNGGESLAELKVVCTAAGQLGKLNCQPQGLNTVRLNQSRRVKITKSEAINVYVLFIQQRCLSMIMVAVK